VDYYDNAAGAGAVHLVRVTDGNEVQAEATLYARYESLLTAMGTLKAKNGGRWGGKKSYHTGDVSSSSDITDTTLDTGLSTFTTDQWKGGYIELEDVPNVQFPIIGNDNTGVISLAADQTMKTQYDALSGSSLRYYLVLENEGKEVTFTIGDGEDSPTTEFSLEVFVDGETVKKYGNLNTDPTSGKYWVDVINEDTGNDEIEAVDLWTGAHTAAVRPANHYGVIDAGLTDTVLTAIIHDFTITLSPGGADATFALGTTTDEMEPQKITVTMTGVGAFDAVSDIFGDLGSGSTDALFTPNNKWTPPFTITEGGTALASGDVMSINYKPFQPDALIGGRVYPDKVNAKNVNYRIVDNDHKTITAADGSDMTTDGAAADSFMVVAPTPLVGGVDGNADLVDADYTQQAYDVDASPFNQLFGKNYGLVKMATPGITATAVQKGGLAYASARNYEYRYEVLSNITTEVAAIDYINDTIGRSDYAVGAFPSYGYESDPNSTEGKLMLVTLSGAIMGREARIAVDYNGYHKAAAGQDAVLPQVLKVTTGEKALNEEILNPAGLQVIKKVKGNFVIWGDRTLYLDPTWKWKHQREQMSYYENVLRESFDWIIFAINDPITENLAKVTLRSFFEPEWVKRALRGATFNDACVIKIDGENNTNATRAAGDMYADITLRLADTVERFIMRLGKAGIFDDAA
ncbi:MAG: hypothetical protein HKP37_08620, partial [Boseongicola sp.]|nr:hypothetical protein [Boseongicola sp.]